MRRYTVERVWVCASQCQLPALTVLDPQVLPVQQRRQPLDAIALVDALAAGLATEGKHVVSKLVDRVFDRLHTPVDDIAAFVLRAFDKILHETSEAGQVGCHRGDAHLRKKS